MSCRHRLPHHAAAMPCDCAPASCNSTAGRSRRVRQLRHRRHRVTALDLDGRPIDLTVNSFAAVSLQPLVTLEPGQLQQPGSPPDGEPLLHQRSRRRPGRPLNRYTTDRFVGLRWSPAAAARRSWKAAPFRSAKHQHPGGDHLIFAEYPALLPAPTAKPALPPRRLYVLADAWRAAPGTATVEPAATPLRMPPSTTKRAS